MNASKELSLHDKITLVISSCDLFSDLWDNHVYQLEKYWGDRDLDTIIITDSPSVKSYPNVKIIAAGAGLEMTDRLLYLLPFINTDYVLLTLDDYFLSKPVSNVGIARLVTVMQNESADYMRLFSRPKKKRLKTSYKNIYRYDMSGDYVVNLYAGIWKTCFLNKTLIGTMNAWEYEVSLSETARKLNASCLLSLGDEFHILDVVRKGKVLNKAHLYFKTHGLSIGTRPVMPIKDEFMLCVKTVINRILSRILPHEFYDSLKKRMGIRSFSSKTRKE